MSFGRSFHQWMWCGDGKEQHSCQWCWWHWQPATGHSWAGISRCLQDAASLHQPFWGHCQCVLIALLFFTYFISFSDFFFFIFLILLPLYCNDDSVITFVTNDFRRISVQEQVSGCSCKLKYRQGIHIFLFIKSVSYHIFNYKAIAFLWYY